MGDRTNEVFVLRHTHNITKGVPVGIRGAKIMGDLTAVFAQPGLTLEKLGAGLTTFFFENRLHAKQVAASLKTGTLGALAGITLEVSDDDQVTVVEKIPSWALQYPLLAMGNILCAIGE